jgi:hypothetical protein
MKPTWIILLVFITACSGSSDRSDGSDLSDLSDGSDGLLAWAVRAGGPQYDFAAGIGAAGAGSSVIGGAFQESIVFGPGEAGETELIAAGDWDAYLARYNSDGVLDWARGIGSAVYDRTWSVSMASDGSAFAAGSFPDAFVVKYESDGTQAWARGAEGLQSVWGRGVSAIADGGCLVAGWFSGTATFGAGEPNQIELISQGMGDVFVSRHNADGSLAWVVRAGGARDDEARGISAGDDGSSAVIGRFLEATMFGRGEPGQTSFTSAGGYDLFLARYNPDGTLDWARHIGGAEHDEPGNVSVAPDGSVLFTASFQGTVVLSPGAPDEIQLTSGGAWDVLVARYNKDGTLSWARTITGASSEHGHVISALPDGGSLVTGWIKGAATFGMGESNQTVVQPQGATDVFLARYEPDGDLTWVTHAGGSGDVSGRGLSALDDGTALVMGAFSESVVFGRGEANETTLTSSADHDLFVVRFEP